MPTPTFWPMKYFLLFLLFQKMQDKLDDGTSFYKVFRINVLFKLILSFQKGTKYKDWTDGDLAIKKGYLFIIEIKNIF